jgi:hypothetical protein
MRIDDVRYRCEEQRVAVGVRTGRDLRRNEPTRAAAIIDDDLLSKTCAQLLRRYASEYVRRTARWKTHDEAHRPIGITLRVSSARDKQHHCSDPTRKPTQ